MKKNSLITHSARIDLRDFAVTTRWLARHNIRPKNKSEAIHYALRALAELILRDEPTLSVDSVEDSIAILMDYGFEYKPDRSSKVGNEVFSALRLEGFGAPENTERVAALEEQFNSALHELVQLKASELTKEEK